MPDSVYRFREEILYRGLYRLSENGSVSSVCVIFSRRKEESTFPGERIELSRPILTLKDSILLEFV